MTEHLRVLIVDDHLVTRKGLRYLLDGEPDIEVVAEASNGREAVELAREHRPTEIVMDIAMPMTNGIDATRQILSEHPETKVLMISSVTEHDMINAALSCGAVGYISKGTSLLDVPLALREIHRGRTFLRLGRARSSVA
ncbi:MAG: response regulator transcription factor [Opitutus sp.]